MNEFLMAFEEAIREYEERTFADWIDGERECCNDDHWEEDTYDEYRDGKGEWYGT